MNNLEANTKEILSFFSQFDLTTATVEENCGSLFVMEADGTAHSIMSMECEA